MDRDQAGDAGALGVLAAHEVARALRRDERDVDAGGRLDLVVEDREAVAEEQQVALGDAVADLVLPDLAVQLVGDEHHHDVAAAGGVGDGLDLEARVLGLLYGRGVLAQAYDDVDARVLEVLRVGVALRAEADDRDGLAVEEGEVCVVVVEHRTAQSMTVRRRPRRRRTSARAREARRCRRPATYGGPARLDGVAQLVVVGRREARR